MSLEMTVNAKSPQGTILKLKAFPARELSTRYLDKNAFPIAQYVEALSLSQAKVRMV